MKILLIDSSTSGHHSVYLKALACQWKDSEIAAIVPSRIEGLSCPQFEIPCNNIWRLQGYVKWMINVRKVIKREKPEIVHFLYADPFYKYFGLGLPHATEHMKVVFTWHVIKNTKLRNISELYVIKKATFCVVHTFSIFKHFSENLQLNNIKHIEYPQFVELPLCSQDCSRTFFSLPKKTPVIACVGGTRYNKGLDIIMDALTCVKKDFHLLIAGKEDDFSEDFIDQKTSMYKKHVTKCIRFITDEEFFHAINAADFIAIPYRKNFDGASGPLVEAVCLQKTIIGPSHGSLKSIIVDNHLGYTFESENVQSLSELLDRILDKKMKYDSIALNYQKSLSPNIFTKKYNSLYNSILKS